MKLRALVLAGALLAATACGGGTTGPVAPKPGVPRLVILIVVDQWPSWSFWRDPAQWHGGLRRLLDDGWAIERSQLPYGGPFTAAGHSTISTGVTPRVHGVLGNTWYRADGVERAADWDARSAMLRADDPNGGTIADGASADQLRVTGVADWLRAETHGRAHSVAIASKSRAACFVAGKRPDLALFYEPEAGGLTTSVAYAAVAPPWVRAFAAAHPVTDATSSKEWLATSDADQLVLDAAVAAIDGEQLGADGIPDLLALSLGAHDYAGHRNGQESEQMHAVEAHLDLALGVFFDQLDRRFGKDGYAVVLTSDHGSTPLIESGAIPDARRVPPAMIAQLVTKVYADVTGVPGWQVGVVSSHVWVRPVVTPTPVTIDPAKLQVAAETAGRALAAIDGIELAGPISDLGDLSSCGQLTGTRQLMCESTPVGSGAALYYAPRRGSIVTEYATGTHHDAPSLDNREVPLLVMGPKIAPRRSSTALATDVAPMLARLLGIEPRVGTL